MNSKLFSLAVLALVSCGPNGLEPLPPKCGGPHGVITASLSAVTLAQDCPSAAAEPKTGVAAGDAAGVCAEGYACPSFCRQSSMQLAFGSQSLHAALVEIRAVRLIDPSTSKVLQTLTSREPQKWDADRYLPWNEIVDPGAQLKTTYKLSAPSYNYSSFSARSAYQPYKVEVDVAIDGEVRTLSAEATREPEVAT